MTAARRADTVESMADLRMPDGLSESERQHWLEDLRRRLVEETGQDSGVVEQHVPGEQPVWAMWGTSEPAPTIDPAPTTDEVAGARPAFDEISRGFLA